VRVADFIEQRLPENPEVTNIAKNPIIWQTTLKMAQLILAAVDRGDLAVTELQERLQKTRPLFGEFFTLVLPECHELVLPEQAWENVFEKGDAEMEERYQDLAAESAKLPDYAAAKKKIHAHFRAEFKASLQKILNKRFDLEDLAPKELLKAESDETTKALELLYQEVQRAMIQAAAESALKEYWDEE
jgi:hypothetical protein